MFDFDKPEDGSQERFNQRLADNPASKIHHYEWWLLHNCVAHPLIGVAPFWTWTFDFHDWTSRKLNEGKTPNPSDDSQASGEAKP